MSNNMTPRSRNHLRSLSNVGSNPNTPRRSLAADCQGDRFIPSRAGTNAERSSFELLSENMNPTGAMAPTTPCKSSADVAVEMLASSSSSSVAATEQAGAKILAFKEKAPAPRDGYANSMRVLYSQNKTASATSAAARQTTRHIAQAPMKILDAPELVDDYYLNLLDWSSQNVLAIALGQSIYLWNASTSTIQPLMTLDAPDNYITSLSWLHDGSCLAVGTNHNDVSLWDTVACKQLRTMSGHQSRVGALAWNNWMLSSGSRDTQIHNHDVRIAQHHISSYNNHAQEVCGLKWNPAGTQLASGGNDNLLNIWDVANTEAPRFTMDQHQAAVKAVAWCPWQADTLATGGGTADRCIKIWNTQTGKCLHSVDTQSQVCSLTWSKHYRELVSSHGFSQNQLTVWKFPTMTRAAELHGHTARVLHMAQSPDGTCVATAAADETLRFWKVFDIDNDAQRKAGATKKAFGEDTTGVAKRQISGPRIR